MLDTLVSSQSPRVTIDLKHIGLPEVPRIGIHKVTEAAEPLTLHRHAGAMEICYLVSGEQCYRAAGRDYRLQSNEVFWTRPNEEHSSGVPYHGKGLLYWMQLCLPSRPSRWLCLTPRDSRPVITALGSLPKRHLVGEKRLKSIFEDIYYMTTAARDPLHKVRIAMRIIDWLTIVIDCAASNPEGGPGEDIRRVLEWIDAGRADMMQVGEMAALAGLSEPHFKAKFRKEVGIPPGEYLSRSRIQRAQKLLAEGLGSVTEIAHQLGFSSSQYFATVFRRFTHQSPRDLIGRHSDQ